MKKLNILIIDDNSGDVRLIKELLKEVSLFQSAVSSAGTLAGGIDMVRNSRFDIILLDLSLPDSLGGKTFFSLKGYSNDTPVVMITGTSDDQLALQLINEGAQDYIVKSDLSSGLLGKAIIHSIERSKLFRTVQSEVLQRKFAYSQLEQTERRYKNLVDQLPVGVIIHTDGIIRFANPAALEIAGANTVDDIVGKPAFQFVHPDFHLMAKERIVRALQSGMKAVEAVEKFVQLDGSEIDVEVNSIPILYENKPSMQVVIKDITDRKKAEEKLTHSEQKFKWLFDYSPTAYHVLTQNGFITDINNQWTKILGYSKEEVIGREVFDFIAPDQQEKSRLSFKKKLEEEIEFTSPSERTFIAKDGSRRIFLVNDHFQVNERQEIVSIQTSMVDITERKIIEDKLFENERLLNESQMISKIGSYTFDITKGIWQASEALNNLFGIEETADHTIQGWLAVIHPDDRQTMAEYLNTEVLGKKERFDREYRIVLPNSEDVRFVHGIGKLEFDDHGNPEKLIGTIQDITERKKSQEMQILFMTAIESAANGIVITNTDGIIMWANNAFMNMTGYTFSEVQGKNPKILKSGRQSHSHYKEMWDTILAGAVWKGEMVNKRKDGSLYIDEMTITPVRNEKNEITHFVAIKQDVTERNRTIEKLEEQAMLLNKAHDAIIVRDLDFKIQFWNRGAEKLYGWKESEVLGKDAREILLVKKDDYPDSMKMLMENKSLEGEFIHRAKSGDELLVNARLSVILDGMGNPKAILSINSDITEKKSIETQLLRAQRMESLGTLAGGIAHDLNNVLSPILLGIVELRKKYTDERSQKFVAAIESSARRGSEIVKQILMFARGTESKRTVIQSRHLIDDLINVFKETFPKSISIVKDIPKNIATIEADPTQFHQLVMNLGVNARDAMPNGGTLTISAENVEVDKQYAKMNINAHEGKYVKFSFIDTGTGMTEQVKDHLFEPFFTTKEMGKGTGLGLATVHTIVNAHKGFIEVHSTIGKGSRFNVYFPVSGKVAADGEHEKTEEELFGNNELILLVDDEESIIEVMEQTLAYAHYKVLTAKNGVEGIAVFSEHKNEIALVISDMMMPEMDGRQFILALKKIKPDLKIIASSGMVEKEQTESLNIDNILMKPYTAEKLLSVIKEVLN